MQTTKRILVALFLTSLLLGCNDPNGPFVRDKDTPQRGTAKIYVDDSFKPLFETAGSTYHGIFNEATIDFTYTTENKSLNALATEGIETIIISRDLTKEEKNKMRAAHIPVTSGLIAQDGITFIVHKSNVDTLFTQEEIKAILTGQTSTWKKSGAPLTVVFDGVQTSNFNYCSELIAPKKFGSTVKALTSNEEVIKHVSENPNSIGVIGFNYLSDIDDPIVLNRRRVVQIVAIADKANKNYWRPKQATLQEKKYPYTRPIYFVSWAAADGLAKGFLRFMNGRQGQLLVDKCEIASGRGTPREINFATE